MKSWIYIFSHFTPEALILEGLFLFLLLCGYTAFWVLRKRKYGVIDDSLPSGPVKTYLDELISHSKRVKIQLFGLNSLNDDPSSTVGKWDDSLSEFQKVPHNVLNDAGQSTAAEKEMGTPSENPSATGTSEKNNSEGAPQSPPAAPSLNSDAAHPTPPAPAAPAAAPPIAAPPIAAPPIAAPPAAAPPAAAPPAASTEAPSSAQAQNTKAIPPEVRSNDVTNGLQKKIQELEAKLAEYSVLENDLANIKQIQQENVQLKGALATQVIATPSQAEKSQPSSDKAIKESVESPFNSPELKEYEKAEADLVSEFEKMLNK